MNTRNITKVLSICLLATVASLGTSKTSMSNENLASCEVVEKVVDGKNKLFVEGKVTTPNPLYGIYGIVPLVVTTFDVDGSNEKDTAVYGVIIKSEAEPGQAAAAVISEVEFSEPYNFDEKMPVKVAPWSEGFNWEYKSVDCVNNF